MDKGKRTVKEILVDAENVLKTAKLGLKDLKGEDYERKKPGLMNVATFGRAFTNVLQNLKSKHEAFLDWYHIYQAEMENDELMKYFYDMRTRILKKGILEKTSMSVKIGRFSTSDMNKMKKPKNTVGYVICDHNMFGASYWIVELEDGTKEKFLFNLPKEVAVDNMYFLAPPKKHLNRSIDKLPIPELASLYIEYLEKMLKDANRKFLK